MRNNRYRLSFRIPTEQELKELRRIHRDRTAGEKAKIQKLEKQLDSALAEMLSGDVPLDALPPKLWEKLKQLSTRVEAEG